MLLNTIIRAGLTYGAALFVGYLVVTALNAGAMAVVSPIITALR